MAELVNFYENLKEAEMRLRDTVVMYDGEPHYILRITNHMPDGIFRVYMEPLNPDGHMELQIRDIPYTWNDEPNMSTGQKMDDYLKKNEGDTLIKRKMMNSPKFHKFRPFPLGMCNRDGKVYYLSRTPKRPMTQQGLTDSMVKCSYVCLNSSMIGTKVSVPGVFSNELAQTIIGMYPTFNDVVQNLADPDVTNEGVAFHRDFAILRGPVRTLFLAYKTDVIGFLPDRDGASVYIDKAFEYTKEVVKDLGVFENVKVK